MTLHVDGGDQRRNARWNRLSLIAMAVGVGMLVSAVVLFGLVLGGSFGGDSFEGPGDSEAFGDPVAVFIPQPSPTPALQPPSDSPIERLLIAGYKVDAPVIVLGLDEDNVMESPDEPCDVAWYDFTSYPGFGSNAVFSGHVDWFNLGSQGCRCDSPGGCGDAGPAVFWDLKNMVMGDLVEVRLQDGTVYQYEVISRRQVSGSSDFREIVSATEKEIITLITCGGTFDPERGHYNDRVVLQAERIVDAPGVVAAP